MNKIMMFLLLCILALPASSLASRYDNMNRYIDQHNIDSPIHAAMGIGGTLLGYYLIPKEYSEVSRLLPDSTPPVIQASLNNTARSIVAMIPIVLFAFIEESYNLNYNIHDPLQVTYYAVGTAGCITLISIDF